MPHIVFNKNNPIKTASSFDGVDFDFIAKSFNFRDGIRNTEYKIGVRNDNKEFLLSLKDKNENQMLKVDKVTRVTPINIVKDALNAYAKTTDANIVFSNTKVLSEKIEPEKEYLKKVQSQCKKVGALLILDEIQPGFGRTGKFFGFEHFDVQPDIMTLAKALANGLPIGAMLAKEQVAEVLNISQATLNRRLKDSEALPEHTVFGGRYLFPIHEVAAYEAAMIEVA